MELSQPNYEDQKWGGSVVDPGLTPATSWFKTWGPGLTIKMSHGAGLRPSALNPGTRTTQLHTKGPGAPGPWHQKASLSHSISATSFLSALGGVLHIQYMVIYKTATKMFHIFEHVVLLLFMA